jgi:putative component of membrane protein insertase Oxa1/YidC/SpoIIIJ protein YidD
VKLSTYITLFIFYLFLNVNLFSQSNSENFVSPVNNYKWQASEISYQVKNKDKKDTSDSSFSIIDGVRYLYKLFISDVDGENCPFQPTCSVFFIRAVKTTNIFQGVLMSADRLTRDLNIVKNHYPITYEGYFLDPAGNYTLNKDKINLLPYNNK